MDETWLYHYDPEKKHQSMEWQHKWLTLPQKIPSAKSAGKVLASIFWDQDGILLTAYLPKGKIINRVLLFSAGANKGHFEGKTTGRRKVTKGVLLLHNNAPAHQALATRKTPAYLGFQCFDHPPVPWTEKNN
jgi:histone-lysine N-methyltransferase SETMAR